METLPRTPALAIARQIWTRHRRGFPAAVVALVATAPLGPILFTHLLTAGAVLVSILPLIGVYGYALNALLFVEEVGNLTSGYPRRMYALPVPTRTLVFWPMLYGSVGAALLWVATAWLTYGPAGLVLPLLAPALGLAALMAWLQAFSWMPLRPAWLRGAGAVALIGVAAGIVLAMYRMSVFNEGALASIAGLALLAAFPAALVGVSRDRRGDLWRAWPEGPWPRSFASRVARRPFRSPLLAQLWYEWRCHGRVLPVAVAWTLLLFFLVLILTGRAFERGVLAGHVIVVLVEHLLLATAIGSVLARMAPSWENRRGAIPFVTTRPMTTGGFVAAKFGMAAMSAALSWAVALIAMALLIANDVRGGEIVGGAPPWPGRLEGGRGLEVLSLGAVCGLALTWRQLTNFVASGLTGRTWVENLAVVPMVVVLGLVLVVILWFPEHPGDRQLALAALPRLVALGIVSKGLIAIGAYVAAIRRGMIGARAVCGILVAWLALVACSVGLAALTLPDSIPPGTRLAAQVGIAGLVPLCRFPLAALALDWHRHGG